MRHGRVLLEAGIALLAADFLVAAGHWFEDNYLPYTLDKSFVGEIARDNEMHHFIPYAVTTHTYAESMRVTALLSACVGAVLLATCPRFTRKHWVGIALFLTILATSSAFHRLQHERDCTKPAVIQALHHSGILCSSEQHRKHHVDPRGWYAVVLGFTNPVYDGLGIWRGLEAVAGCLGAERHLKQGNDFYSRHHTAWLVDNMAKACPTKLTKPQLKHYYRILDSLYFK